jgi:tRNA 2-selenouridine synthase
MIHQISIGHLIDHHKQLPVFDVRTPAEFAHGHIPRAISLPLFTDEERVQIGTTYKQVGREAAVLLGFDLTGPKWSGFIKQVLAIAHEKSIAVHCWRGGMRSGAMAWALSFYGFEVYVITGGYKAYRHLVHEQFHRVWQFAVVGGMTGSGKTNILRQLQEGGEQVIDLEELARHQGSVYGSMNNLQQPSQEQFENNLAEKLFQTDPDKVTWIEDESITIGKRQIPKPFWRQMQLAVLFDLNIEKEQRVQLLEKEYGRLDKGFLLDATERIRKRVGPEQCKHAIEAINENRMADFISIVLMYYDKAYKKCLAGRRPENIHQVTMKSTDKVLNARTLLHLYQTIKYTKQQNEPR